MRTFCLILTVLFLNPALFANPAGPQSDANNPAVELLWPQGAPGAKGDSDADKPTLTVFLPPKDKACGTAVVICPGGAYQILAADHEGRQIARWLNSFGVAGFLLKYRLPSNGYPHPAPLQDSQRAIRTVRAKAKTWNIDPNRVGIIGFSAGGHLAATTGTLFHKTFSPPVDGVDNLSPRPDFMILVYPLVTLSSVSTHTGSRNNLLGPEPNEALITLLSADRQVTPQTCPTFLLHCTDDTAVGPRHSILFYQALRAAAVPAELHIYGKGGHGFGLGAADTSVSTWPLLCRQWLAEQKLCPAQ